MAAAITFDQGASPLAGINHEASGSIAWDAACTATGDTLDLSAQFSTIDSIKVAGASAIEVLAYVPNFFFAKGAAAADGVKVAMMQQDGDAGALVGSTVDLSSAGTLRVEVRGKAATS